MALDERTKELVAVGASITANCGPCLEYHTRKAREAGADGAEIAQAADVGRLVRKGAAGKLDALSAKILEGLAVSSSEGCGCAT
jgi:AhpD family alkylhydroperoxidase